MRAAIERPSLARARHLLYRTGVRAIFVVAAASCGACNEIETTTRKDGLAMTVVLRLDDAHNHAVGDDHALIYEMPAGDAVILDPGDYTIPAPPSLGADRPNAVQVILGKGEIYRASWDGRGPLLLSATTLEAVGGSGRFRGFPAGRRCVIGVGRDRSLDAKAGQGFDMMWATLVDVRSSGSP